MKNLYINTIYRYKSEKLYWKKKINSEAVSHPPE